MLFITYEEMAYVLLVRCFVFLVYIRESVGPGKY
jgi:hypothetical protein